MDHITYKFPLLLSKIFFDPMSLMSRLTQSQPILSLDANNIQSKTMEDNQEPLLAADMAVGAVTVEAPVDEPKKGRVLVLNGLPGTGKTSIVKSLKERLPGQKVQIVDSPIMAGPFCAHSYQREYRSAYLHEIRRLADQGYTILVTASLANSISSQRVIQDILEVVCGKDISLFWINISRQEAVQDQQISNSTRLASGESKTEKSEVLLATAEQGQLVLPSSLGNKLDGISLITRVMKLGNDLEEAVKKVSEVMA
ncbi:chloramphenicol phosphotransferase [Fusarium pseudoanthophilum]|uniref:Chloramphenicol phosphotransferase n=1 Tax=Fusarium pseudoanthophilum TaxID=48495 RepID=A0A8H5PBE7_9HYPO|nr:chloramphenicol phosphotransferase [Fusarium pseudoanthophilum]